MGIPTCRGADDAKKKPPRETLRASVKCSVRSEATPRARKRRGVRRLRRLSWRRSATFIVSSTARGNILAQALANSVERCLQRNRATPPVKYQTFNGQSVPVPASGRYGTYSYARTRAVSRYHNASLTVAKNALNPKN